MSFFSYKNCNRDVCPGKINANDSTRGLCERVCVNVNKVYDSCIQQDHLENIPITLTEFCNDSPCPEQPLTFISCKSASSKGVIRNLTIDSIPDREHFARVRCTVDIPIEIFFEDANGVPGCGFGTISVNKDVILYVPEESIIPYTINSIVSAICVGGSYAGRCSFVISCCATIILKVVADVELLIPSYGFCPIPPCEEFATEVCDQFFSLPIFPRQTFEE